MSTLKYTVIEDEKQYFEYCNILEKLVFYEVKTEDDKKEIKLLTLLIEKWDEEHDDLVDLDPVRLLQALMNENGLKQKNLGEVLRVSKSVISEILHYKRGLSKENIRKLADYFKVNQEAFNRPYKLTSRFNNNLKATSAGVMNTPKKLVT